MFKFFVVLLGVVIAVVTGKFQPPPDICSGTDVSREPRLEARQLDGWYYTQAVLTQTRASNTIFFNEFQAKSAWGNDWNETTQECTYRKFDTTQRQSVTLGPFSPCVTSQQVLETGERLAAFDILYWLPNKDMLMFYICSAEVAPNGFCTEQPFVRILTRNIDITRRQLNMFRRKLRSLGVSLDSLSVVNPRENRCPIPPDTFFGANKRTHGRKRNIY